MKYIYLYTTASYALKNWYKIGETVIDPKQRVQSQDNASNPEPLIFIISWKVPSYITDKKVHKKLLELGFSRIRREWFELSELPKDDIFSALLDLTNFVQTNEPDSPSFYSTIPIKNYTEMWWFKNNL